MQRSQREETERTRRKFGEEKIEERFFCKEPREKEAEKNAQFFFSRVSDERGSFPPRSILLHSPLRSSSNAERVKSVSKATRGMKQCSGATGGK